MPTNQQTASLKLVASLQSTSDALQHTLMALANCQGSKSRKWLDDLEASIIRNTKNMVFTGTNMDAEARAVEAALANLKLVFGRVRGKLQAATKQPTVIVTVSRKPS